MSCKYCGKSTETGVTICTECNSILAEYEKPKAKKWLYSFVFWGLLLPTVISIIYSVISYISISEVIPDYGRQILINAFISLPSNGYIWLGILIILIATKKIDTYCCEREDAILWTGMRWIGFFLPITFFVQTIIAYRGERLFSGWSIFTHAQNIFEMPGLWINICLISFLLVRSGKMEFNQKKMVIIPCILVAWSLLLVFFGDILLKDILRVEHDSFVYSRDMWKLSAMFMWLRYLILMWFVVSWAKKQIGFVCITLCIMCFGVLPGMLQIVFIESDAPLMLWTDSNIAYIVAGIILFVSKYINKRSAVEM